MKKKILFVFLFFGLCLAIAYPVKAAKVKVKIPKKITAIYGKNNTKKKVKVYFHGRNITEACKIRVEGKNKKYITTTDGAIIVKTEKAKKKSFTAKITLKFKPSKIEPWKNDKEIDEFFDDGYCEYYDAYGDEYDEDYAIKKSGGDTYNIVGNYIDSYFFGWVKKKDFYKTYKITKKIKIKIKNNKKLQVTSWLLDYYTRGNYFSTWIKNRSHKSITILGYGAKAIDKDYKSYDRNLRTKGNRNYVIKPGKGKYIDFYVNGSPTWPNVKDFTIKYKVSYNGKIHTKKARY